MTMNAASRSRSGSMPNEIVEIAVRFTKYSGRYMYHCHILEHEDRDMMRPFVTMPADLMPFMA